MYLSGSVAVVVSLEAVHPQQNRPNFDARFACQCFVLTAESCRRLRDDAMHGVPFTDSDTAGLGGSRAMRPSRVL
jgi:hypothetical protein